MAIFHWYVSSPEGIWMWKPDIPRSKNPDLDVACNGQRTGERNMKTLTNHASHTFISSHFQRQLRSSRSQNRSKHSTVSTAKFGRKQNIYCFIQIAPGFSPFFSPQPRKFRGVFREQLDPQGRPVPFSVFRNYMQAAALAAAAGRWWSGMVKKTWPKLWIMRSCWYIDLDWVSCSRQFVVRIGWNDFWFWPENFFGKCCIHPV